MRPRWKSGTSYTPLPTGTILSGSLILNELRLAPIDIPRPTKFDQIASEVSVLAAGGLLRWAVYADDGSGAPGALILDTGAVGDASTTGLKTTAVSIALGARRYWVGLVNQGAAVSVRSTSGASRPIGVADASLTSTFANGLGAACHYQSGVSGALPATFVSAGVRTQGPIVYLRVA